MIYSTAHMLPGVVSTYFRAASSGPCRIHCVLCFGRFPCSRMADYALFKQSMDAASCGPQDRPYGHPLPPKTWLGSPRLARLQGQGDCLGYATRYVTGPKDSSVYLRCGLAMRPAKAGRPEFLAQALISRVPQGRQVVPLLLSRHQGLWPQA